MTTGSRFRPQSGGGGGGGRRGGPGGFQRRGRRRRNAITAEDINYKDVQLMRRFVTERGKIVSARRIGVTAKNQRALARAIKRAQHLALIPIAPNHTYVTGSVQSEQRRPAAASANGEQPGAAPTPSAPADAGPRSAGSRPAENGAADSAPERADR